MGKQQKSSDANDNQESCLSSFPKTKSKNTAKSTSVDLVLENELHNSTFLKRSSELDTKNSSKTQLKKSKKKKNVKEANNPPKLTAKKADHKESSDFIQESNANSTNSKFNSFPEHFLKNIGSIKASISFETIDTHQQDNIDPIPVKPDIRKEFCLYCTLLGPIAGILTLTHSSVTFEPDPRCVEVLDYGLGHFQVYIDINDILEAAATMIPDGPFLTKYLGFAHEHKSQYGECSVDEPGFIQILTKIKLEKATPVERELYKEVKKNLQNVPDYVHILLNPSNTIESISHQDFKHETTRKSTMHSIVDSKMISRVLSNFGGISPRSSSSSTPPIDTITTPRVHSESISALHTSTLLLFRFTHHDTAKDLTMYLIDTLDKRMSRQTSAERCASLRLPIHSKSLDWYLPQSVSIDSIPARQPFKFFLSCIPFSSNKLLEVILSSTTTQNHILDVANKYHQLHTHFSTAELTAKEYEEHQETQGDSDSSLATNISRTSDTKYKVDRGSPDFFRESTPQDIFQSSSSEPFSNHQNVFWSPQVKLPSESHVHCCLLTKHVASELCTAIPVALTSKAFELKFCTQRHGLSYKTFFHNLFDAGPAIFLVNDMDNTLFGGFCPTGVHKSPRYYGTGETFVFTFKQPGDEIQQQKTDISSLRNKISVFAWTSKNNYFTLTTSQSIAFGGGGAYALTIDSNFLRGSSNYCETFANPVLSSTIDFVVQNFQVWCFTDP